MQRLQGFLERGRPVDSGCDQQAHDHGAKEADAQVGNEERGSVSTAPGSGPSTPVISARGVGKRFAQRWVLSDVDLEVEPGCVFGLLGRNGAGKTTLLRVLLGLLAPEAGTSSVLGMDSVKDGNGVRQACGTVLGVGALYGELSVWDNLEFAARAWGVSKSRRPSAIKEALAWAGVAERRSDKARALSQGMRQRVALAMAIVHEPKVLVLDEPTTGLDVPAANALRDHVRRWCDQSAAAVILSSHDLYEMDRLCDRIGLLQDHTLVTIERTPPLPEGIEQGWVLRLGTGSLPELSRLGGSGPKRAQVRVEAGATEVACGSLAEARALRDEAAQRGASSAKIVLRHDGDLAKVFADSAVDEEGLGCVR